MGFANRKIWAADVVFVGGVVKQQANRNRVAFDKHIRIMNHDICLYINVKRRNDR